MGAHYAGIENERSTMSKILLELSVSLDGFVGGPDISPATPMGRGGERFHEWMFAGKSATEIEEAR
jgi:hypothetical protein